MNKIEFHSYLTDTLCQNAYTSAFWLAFILLLIITFQKYYIKGEATGSDIWDFSMEILIDAQAIVISILVSRLLEIGIENGLLFLFVTVFVTVASCYFRKRGLHPTSQENWYGVKTLWTIASLCLSGSWIWYVYSSVILYGTNV